jgi:hypothetical protein
MFKKIICVFLCSTHTGLYDYPGFLAPGFAGGYWYCSHTVCRQVDLVKSFYNSLTFPDEYPGFYFL